jgi:FkbM family methyltransferase
MATPFFSKRLLEQISLHAQFGVHSLQTTVFLFKGLHLAHHGGIHPAILRASLEKRRRTDPAPPAQIRHKTTNLSLAQRRQDLAFRKTALLHRISLSHLAEKTLCRTPIKHGGELPVMGRVAHIDNGPAGTVFTFVLKSQSNPSCTKIRSLLTEIPQSKEVLNVNFFRRWIENLLSEALDKMVVRVDERQRSLLEELLTRERLFRENFTHKVNEHFDERQRSLLEDLLTRERLFREDFTHKVNEQLKTQLLGSQRLRASLALVKDSQILTHTVDGHRILLDPSEPFIAFHVLETGEWERPLRQLLARILVTGGRYLDVGGNIGLHALYAASLMGIDGRVLALEPHPKTAALFRKNMEINGFQDIVLMVEAAAAEVDGGTRRFEYFVDHSAMSGFSLGSQRLASFPGTVEQIDVPVVSLDALLSRNNFAPDVVKIDVEGFELNVLKGASELIGGTRDVAFIIEHAAHYTDSVMGLGAARELVSVLEQGGFQAYLVVENGCKPVSIDDLDHVGGDILFLKPGSPKLAKIQVFS